MVSNFNARKVDLKKVSQTVKNFVENIAKLEGNKKKIDSAREYSELANLLAGNGYIMNNDEIGYIQGFMFEYQNKKNDESITENTKKEVSKIAKRMGDKKKIDTDEEAQALVIMLRNSHNELNSADLAYIQNLLIQSGYAHYLEQQLPQVNVVNVIVNETVVEKNTEKNNENLKKDTESKKTDGEPNVEPKKNKKLPPKNNVKPAPKPKEKDAPPKEKPTVDEDARAQGFGIANKIEEELHDTWTNNDVIKNELKKVNSKNAYSFVGKMIEITDTHSVFGDSRKRITYNEFKRVSAALLNQAKNIGITPKSPAYQALKAEYDNACRQVNKDFDKTPDEFDTNKINKALLALYDEMSKVFKNKTKTPKGCLKGNLLGDINVIKLYNVTKIIKILQLVRRQS